MNGTQPRLRWHQWSLRTLLAVMTLAAVATVAAGWWFRPFVVETHRPDGSLRTRFEVRRDWQGQTVACGRLEWFLPDGTTFTRTAYGIPLDESEFAAELVVEGNFDSLIWLITETVAPKSWGEGAGPGSTDVSRGCTILVADTAEEPPTSATASTPCCTVDGGR